MRLRLAFKLHGEEAAIARQIADAAGIDVDKVAKLAMQRYIIDVLERANRLAEEQNRSIKENSDADGQPSNPDPIHPAGTISSPSDTVPGEASGQP
jgi:hypothetical protein